MKRKQIMMRGQRSRCYISGNYNPFPVSRVLRDFWDVRCVSCVHRVRDGAVPDFRAVGWWFRPFPIIRIDRCIAGV